MKGGASTPRSRGFDRAARAIVTLRYPIVLAWVAAAVLAVNGLPSIFAAKSGTLNNLLSSSAQPLVAEREALRKFGLPLLSHSVAVTTDERSLTGAQLNRAISYVAEVDRRPFGESHLRAVPLFDAPGFIGNAFPPSGNPSSARPFIAYLYVDPALRPSL